MSEKTASFRAEVQDTAGENDQEITEKKRLPAYPAMTVDRAPWE